MKLNGKTNIITDRDITITEGLHLGDNLSDILDSQQKDINSLKSNVKWLYKYGGVGSGKGGGGSSSTSWSLYVSMGGKIVESDNTISLDPNASSYAIQIKIVGGTSAYSVHYSYGTVSRTITLDASNNWTITVNTALSSNGIISVSATDNIDIKTKYANYIVRPYEFGNIRAVEGFINENGNLQLGNEYSSNDIFIERAIENGLLLVSNYSIAVSAETNYSWSLNGISFEPASIDDRTGTIVYEIVKKGDVENWSAMDAGAFNAQLSISVTPEGDLETIINKTYAFNLMPESLYLRILPGNDGEIFYDEKQELDFYTYKVNQRVSFNVKTYKGSNLNRTVTYKYSYSFNGTENEVYYPEYTSKEQVTDTLSMVFAAEGWYKLRFIVTISGGDSVVVEKWIYCRAIKSDYNWFFTNENNAIVSSGASLIDQQYFRLNRSFQTHESFNWSDQLVMTTASEEFVQPLKFPKLSIANATQDFIINIGIQYNYINDTDNKILSLFTNGVNTGDSTIDLYQNKVVVKQNLFDSESIAEIFLRKEDDYDFNINYNESTETIKSHLITIAWTKLRTEGEDKTYQCCVYLDGILESSVISFSRATAEFNAVKFHPGNYNINLFDITYASGSEKWAFNDVDVNYYYNTYKEQVSGELIPENETIVLNNFYDIMSSGATYSLNNNLIQIQSGIADNIAEQTPVPTLILQRDKIITEQEGNVSVTEWMNHSYKDGDTGMIDWTLPVTAYWSSGNRATTQVQIPSEFGVNTRFTLQIQGSSTKSQKSKNFTFAIKSGTDVVEQGQTILFSPNYKKSDHSTFLPEQEFTLKADIVDSSHSNNTSIGAFVNDNNGFKYDINQTGDPDVLAHTRQCLEGFPVLVYMHLKDITGDSSKDEFYYLGIYNFNLGRGSYFNLGYCDQSQLTYTKDVDPVTNPFTFVSVSDISPKGNFIAAEIQDNKKFWDFSQFDQSILFKDENSAETANFMFGDIVNNTNIQAYVKGYIQDFVRSIAYGGGYIFQQLGKTFKPIGEDPNDNTYLYHTIGVVPDFKQQYIRKNDIFVAGSVLEKASSDALKRCVLETEGEDYIPALNYDSSVYYYTTCMIFGLVDSVQKNLNIKTWDGKQFGLYFYDMDTSLGISNSGDDISSFCFSDYWKTNITENGEDENGEPIYLNNGVIVHRDYVPSDVKGAYDIPSSYLFAIPKYAGVMGESYTGLLNPQELYAQWRKTGGVLETAESFINKYFAKNLCDIPKVLLNLNYRNKFLYKTSGEMGADASANLKGTRIEKTRDWFASRLRILDAYFNLPRNIYDIYIENEAYINGNSLEYVPTGYQEPVCKLDVKTNTDVYVFREIFNTGDTDIQRYGDLDFIVTSDAYSPLIVRKGNEYARYLLEKENTKYQLKIAYTGNQSSRFGGSSLWRSLDKIDTFISSLNDPNTFTLNSDRLKNVLGKTGTITENWNLTLPAIQDLKLNSPNYRGKLNIDSKFFNLQSIDISKSSITLNINGNNVVKTINLNNVTSAGVSIMNTTSIENVTFNNASIDSFVITPCWVSDFAINSSHRIKELQVYGAEGSVGDLSIKDNSTLKTLGFQRFKTLDISNCSNLKTITCDEAIHNLTSVSIVNCTSLTSLSLPIDNVKTIDLSGCSSLEEIILVGSGNTFPTLTGLNLSKTRISKIIFKKSVADLGESVDSYLDLTRFPNLATNESDSLSYFDINGNNVVEYIQFINDEFKPVYLKRHFQSCSALKRVFGNMVIKTTSCFYNLPQFSIHGSDLSEVAWNNKKTISEKGLFYMPNELIGVLMDEVTDTMLFQSGNGVANLTIHGNGSSSFYGTNCTVFDYYYIFTRGTKLTNASGLFRQVKNETYGCFYWNETVDNSPKREMFKKCTNLTDLSTCFYGVSHSGKLYSPSNDGYVVLSDDGLFSPLVNLQTVSYMFSSNNICIDRFVLQRKSGKYNIKNLYEFSPYVIHNDINNAVYQDISELNLNFDNFGNLTGFFKSLPNVDNVTGFLRNCYFIDYEITTDFKFPKNVTSIKECMNSNYGSGTLILKNLFDSPNKIVEILNSFRTTSKSSNKSVRLELSNDTFVDFVNLTKLGYESYIDGNHAGRTYQSASFYGNGVDKVIVGGEFPFDIFKNNPKLTNITSVFANATSEGTINNLKLPGNLLQFTPNLTTCEALFYNIKCNYTLSESEFDNDWNIINNVFNFSKCTKLNNVSRVFGSSYSHTDIPRLSGKIPVRLFYHGGNWVTKTLMGSNDRTRIDDDKGNFIMWDYGDVQEEHIRYFNCNKNIKNISYCFQHSNCSEYQNDNWESLVETNENYNPFVYNTTDGTLFIENKSQNSYLKTAIWCYDGGSISKMKSDYECLDFIGRDHESVTYNNADYRSLYYICPPDLLRYCSNSSDTNVAGLFDHSGIERTNLNITGIDWKTYGITGRICPYMLKPISNITDISYMFSACKKLSGYIDNTTRVSYIVPETFFTYAPNITTLTHAFSYLMFPKTLQINVFSSLKGNLVIDYLFYGAVWGESSSNYLVVSETFKDSNINKLNYAFANSTSTSSESGFEYNQYVTFSDIFNSKYKGTSYATNTSNYSGAFLGYNKNYVIFENKSLANNTTTKNYMYIGGSIPE